MICLSHSYIHISNGVDDDDNDINDDDDDDDDDDDTDDSDDTDDDIGIIDDSVIHVLMMISKSMMNNV